MIRRGQWEELVLQIRWSKEGKETIVSLLVVEEEEATQSLHHHPR
jgi:hypothetical protein